MTKNGFKTLAGEQKKPQVVFNKQKNTNDRGYTIDSQNDDNPYRNPELNSFLRDFGSLDSKPAPPKKKKGKQPVAPEEEKQETYSQSIMKGLFDTYSYYTKQPEKVPEPQINPKFDELKEKLENVQNANLIKVDPSDQLTKKRNNIKNFDVSDYLFEN